MINKIVYHIKRETMLLSIKVSMRLNKSVRKTVLVLEYTYETAMIGIIILTPLIA